MAISTYPAASAGGIKSVQRGSAGGAGNVTITAVDIAKSFVTVFGTTSSGTVAASGTINATSGNIGAQNGTLTRITSSCPIAGAGTSGNSTFGNIALNSTSYNANSTNLTGGSNNLVAAVVQGYLSNSTTLVVSGACRWEVVEFN
jgi:hypothetical protein